MKWLALKVLIVSVLTVNSRIPPDEPKPQSFIDHVNVVSKKISIDMNEDLDSDMESSMKIADSVSRLVQTRENTLGSKNGEGHHSGSGEVLNTDADATLITRKGKGTGRMEGCAAGEELVGGQCLTFSEEALNWQDATIACRAAGGRLAIPADPAAVADYVVDTYGDWKRFWVGGSDIEEEGTWKFSNGVTIDPKDFPWTNRQPDNYGTGENCLEVYHNGAYNDDFCTRKNQYICERGCSFIGNTRWAFTCEQSDVIFQLFYGEWKDFDDARSSCNNKGAFLALPSDNTAANIRNFIMKNYGEGPVWVAGRGVSGTGLTNVNNGKEITTNLWRSGKPEKNTITNNSCMTMLAIEALTYKSPDKPYSTFNCMNRAYVLCQYPKPENTN